MKYSDQIANWLVELGYTHCFYVGGGNIMHLVESISRQLDCRAVIHEVAAGVAAEYFNATSDEGKALALVTAGPGMTNVITAIAGAYLESRELLVIGGQVKTADLARGELRQKGIQEIDGVKLAEPISNQSVCMVDVWDKDRFSSAVLSSASGRPGPVFLEIPLDVQARETSFSESAVHDEPGAEAVGLQTVEPNQLELIVEKLNKSQRPVLMIGGGISRSVAWKLNQKLAETTVPVVTTWNGIDRIGKDHPNYVGRPNTWGQRSANILLQQADLLIALGTRLGMQQTGFNWQEFIPNGEVVQIEIDRDELNKGHPIVDYPICADADDLLIRMLEFPLGDHKEWLNFCRQVRKDIPLVEDVNEIRPDYVSPHNLVQKLSDLTKVDDVIIPCSSGGAFTTMMQVFEQTFGQKIVTNKGLASMGYGLSGAIGASVANPDKRVVLVEGDGGFAQNIQEIGTAAINNCNMKMFIFDDGGYASIRMTQRSYFNGRYVGCDTTTGLGLPNWELLFSAWGVEVVRIDVESFEAGTYIEAFEKEGLVAFIVSINPEQTYFPKISSRVTESGSMESNPLHIMTPELPEKIHNRVFRYI